MLDIETEIADWRRQMAATGLTPEVLDELEEHLREDIDRQVKSGTPPAEAFLLARRRLGTPRDVGDEFARIRSPGLFATLRRHKGKFLLCAGLGLLAAFVLSWTYPKSYQAETRLLVRYFAGPLRPAATDTPPDRFAPQEPTGFKQEQMQRITSEDLLRKVASAVGPQLILKSAGGGDDLEQATRVIRQGLRVSIPPRAATSVEESVARGMPLSVTFSHPDPLVLEPVLNALTHQFLKLHAEIHRERGRFDPTQPSPWIDSIITIQAPITYLDVKLIRKMITAIIAAGIVAGLGWVYFARLSEMRLKLAR